MTNPFPGAAAPKLYETEFQAKLDLSYREFSPFYKGEIAAFRSPVSHFRVRAEFRIWHDGDGIHYVMFETGEKGKPLFIEDFSIGDERITELMPKILEKLTQHEELRLKLFQIEFLCTLSGEMLVTLIYHRALNASWQLKAEMLQKELGISIIGRSRKQKLVLNRDFVVERFKLSNGVTEYVQIENSFTQPNASVCRDMLNWAIEKTEHCEGDLLELYCGNGNFTIPLSRNFDRVLATEISKTSTRSALENIQRNLRDNIHIVRLSAEEVCEALDGIREFRRLSDIDLESYKFSTVFVDPPRAGLDLQTVRLCSQFDRILYISCNPGTLLDNLAVLATTHKVTSLALFDQFPYTQHRECGVVLEKIKTEPDN